MIISGTGHRPDKLGGYDVETQLRLYTLAFNNLSVFKPEKVITGMALGWDTALAVACSDLKIPFIAAVPFRGQHLKWNLDLQDRYNIMLLEASEVVYVSDEGYAPYKFQLRNMWMVDNSELVLALWNGDEEGGTYNCIQYALDKNKPIVNLYDEYVSMKEG